MRTASILALTAAVAAAAAADTRGRQLVQEALAALGGERFLAMENRVESGRAYSFYREELSGLARATIYTQYLKQPDPGGLLLRERQSFGNNEDRGAVLFTGGNGYEITFRGARPLPDSTLERFRLGTLHNIFYILRQRLSEPGLTLEYRGSDIADSQPVEIVDITDAENRTVTVSFDRSTRLPVRQVYVRRDPKTRERFEEVTVFSKYRDAGGGVQWPFVIQRERNGEKIFEMYSDAVRINQKLADSLFTLPPNIKILKPLK